MSYQVLARKWRPRSFPQMVGQEHVLRALINALDNDRLHHAFLFTGTRGVGKTSVARILAKSLNCEQGMGSNPCGQCSACREIDEGRFVDLIEVDAASRTKVEDTRELLDNVQYAPSRGRYKVYLIDEVHMLSGHSFNALLKTLEEPPPHVKFLLATTDPQKLPVTILSRCLQFSLKRLPLGLIRDHLQMILDQEGVVHEAPALLELARAADGSMRDALSLLDQAIAHGGGQIQTAEVQAMLGSIDRQRVFALLARLAEDDGAGLMAEVAALAEQSPDYAGVLNEMNSLLQRLALARQVPAALDDSLGDREALLALSGQFEAEQIQLYYQIGVQGRRDLPLAPEPRQGFEMVLLRMLAFQPARDDVSSRPSGNTGIKPAIKPVSETPGNTPFNSASGGTGAAVQSASLESTATAAQRPAPEPVAVSAAPAAQVGAASRPAPGSSSLSDPGAWAALVAALPLSGMTRQLAEHCSVRQQQDDCLVLSLDPNFKNLLNPKWEEGLREALGKHYGRAIRLELALAEEALATPKQLREDAQQARQQDAQAAIENDPQLRSLMEQFEAGLIPDSVRPV
ncbi:MAG: DNA polymerase III subunit gamma/tau [Thiohalomonadaceae bacterium]